MVRALGRERAPSAPRARTPQPFTIVNPPPNVTGSLHIGHALDNTLQDVVIRYERLRGKDALWVVGTDHAGIATQMVVERQMAERQDKRTNYSREDFVAKVWEWKHESGGTITRQLRRLGCSMDWSREQFTMDPHFSAAVTKVFVDLYNQRPDLPRQAAGELGPGAQDRDLRPRGGEPRGARPHVALQIPARGRRDLHLRRARRGRERHAGGGARLHLDRHHPARDDAGRRRGGGASIGRALCAHRRQVLRNPGGAKGAPPPDPDHHRRLSRSRLRKRRGEDHRRARRERLWRRQPQRHPDVPADGRGRGDARRRRALCRGVSAQAMRIARGRRNARCQGRSTRSTSSPTNIAGSTATRRASASSPTSTPRA